MREEEVVFGGLGWAGAAAGGVLADQLSQFVHLPLPDVLAPLQALIQPLLQRYPPQKGEFEVVGEVQGVLQELLEYLESQCGMAFYVFGSNVLFEVEVM